MHPAGPTPPQRPFPPIQYQWVAGPGDASRAAASAARATMWNRLWWVLYAMITVLVIRDYLYDIGLGVFMTIVVAVLLGIVFLLCYLYYLTAMKAMTSPGTVWATGFGPTALSLITPFTTSVIDYAAITAARRVGSIVVIRYRGGTLFDAIPSQLVPEAEFDLLRRVAKSR